MAKPTVALQNARSDVDGFGRIARLYAELCAHSADEIDLDAAKVSWIDANLAAPLFATVRLLSQKHGKKVGIKNLSPSLRDIFQSNGLIKAETPKSKNTVIPLKVFSPGEGKYFAEYTNSYFIGKGMPNMSASLRKGFFEGIDEIFQNSEIHSKTQIGIFTCGQWFPKLKRLDFSMVDLGVGFEEAIFRGIGERMPAAAAIAWAMTGRNTTRKLDVPGGLGLKILKEFVRLNGGRLSIVSHRGYWCMERKGVTMSTMVAPFPGTVVTLEINTADTASYKMSGEVDPASLF